MTVADILYAPAYCRHCRTLVIADYYKKDPKCETCGKTLTFYNDATLHSPEKLNEAHPPVFEWGAFNSGEGFVLPDTAYLCPFCGKKTLQFIDVGNWD